MLKTLYIAGSIAAVFLLGIFLITVSGAASLSSEYLEFALALAMCLVLLIGAYWFVVRDPGRHM